MDIAEIARVEALMAEGWPAARTRVLAGWTCQLDAGVTRRCNSVLPLAWNGDDPDAAVDAVEALYAAQGLPPVFKISPASRPEGPDGLDARLAARGYRLEGASLVLTCRLAAAPQTAPRTATQIFAPKRPAVSVALAPAPEPAWSAICHGAGPQAEVRAAIVARLRRPRIFALASVAESGGATAPAAAGLGVRLDDWLLITALATRPALRRRGAARAVVAALADWGGAEGARRMILQVEAGNAAARRLYAELGWAPAYAYAYRATR